jgi:hypothetical protein
MHRGIRRGVRTLIHFFLVIKSCPGHIDVLYKSDRLFSYGTDCALSQAKGIGTEEREGYRYEKSG